MPAPDPFSHVQPFQVWENGFTPEELDAIEAYGDRLELKRGTVLSDGPEITYDALRIARTAVMAPAPEIAWLYQRIERVVRVLNGQSYRFDLMGFAEPFQYMVYRGEEGGHFNWHVDNGRLPAARKLSATLQLTEGAQYEGCDLEFFGTHQPEAAPRSRGSLVIFPSYVLHRVTPIRAGTRKALVIWSTGPNFR
jgi:PKHD-type hydroxylase